MAERADRGLLVFARAPVAGQVKTRLRPALGAEGAARLHARLIERTLAVAAKCAVDGVELWCAPDTANPAFLAARGYWKVSLHGQPGGDLGARMHCALEDALVRYRRAVLVGSDCPVLSTAYLDEAFARLEDTTAVLGPAEDGGYVLVGLREASAVLFADIDWGGDRVLRQTRMRLCALGWRWHELAVLWDVDRPEDLARLAALGLDDVRSPGAD